MDLSTPTIVTVLGAFAGIVSTWATLGYRLRALEGERKALRALEEKVGELAKTLEHVRTDQGRRLGDVGDQVKELRGEVRGFRDGFGAGRRSRTAAHGNKLGGAGDNG